MQELRLDPSEHSAHLVLAGGGPARGARKQAKSLPEWGVEAKHKCVRHRVQVGSRDSSADWTLWAKERQADQSVTILHTWVSLGQDLLNFWHRMAGLA
eukprot:1157343-Pelagomonas_calceolata.AAC.2